MKELKSLTTFESACKIEGLDPKKVIPDFSNYPKKHRTAMIAHAKIVIMIDCANRLANNDKVWIANYDDPNQDKWEPRFYKPKGSSGFRFHDCDGWDSGSHVGSRLCFFSYDTMKYMVENKHYMKLFNEYAL